MVGVSVVTSHPRSPNCGRSDTSALPLSASVCFVQVCFLLTANGNVLYRCLVYAFLDQNLVITHLSTLLRITVLEQLLEGKNHRFF